MLRVRWLGRVPYSEAFILQTALHRGSRENHLLLLEHPHVFTLGLRGDLGHILVDPADVGADVVRTNRGGDVTYHGPGQLVGYPIVDVATGPSSMPCHVADVEQVVIDALGTFGLVCGRLPGYPGVWVDPEGPSPRKICAIGVRVSRERSMHGFALNVDPDLGWFRRIVPCGIADKEVTSMRAEGVAARMEDVVDAVVQAAVRRWAPGGNHERQDVSASAGARAMADGPRLHIRLRQAGVDPDGGLALATRKPEWLRVPAHMGPEFRDLRHTLRSLDLVTVCEEAGCPNIFECWADGTATFMINGDRCTRACGFCLVDTRHPLPLDDGEPARVASAVARLGLAHAVVTAVARDDLADGGAAAFAATVAAIRARCPGTAVELLIPDCKGDADALATIFGSAPDVLNHNIETVARLQRAVRPSAGYARSLSVLARAHDAGLTTKSGLILGMGEEEPEVVATLADLRAVGVDIVTLGQYLRPTARHLPVARWWTPAEFERVADAGRAMGFAHVQASPLTRSSYHARAAAGAAAGAGSGAAAGAAAAPRAAAGSSTSRSQVPTSARAS
ncbi:MAG TPA: lipoyl synthase [Acidimicrobiales bacterium]|nr:lipoyl synthase [Acidimicrobiales bacterium]